MVSRSLLVSRKHVECPTQFAATQYVNYVKQNHFLGATNCNKLSRRYWSVPIMNFAIKRMGHRSSLNSVVLQNQLVYHIFAGTPWWFQAIQLSNLGDTFRTTVLWLNRKKTCSVSKTVGIIWDLHVYVADGGDPSRHFAHLQVSNRA